MNYSGTGNRDIIQKKEAFACRKSEGAIGRIFGVNRMTVDSFLKNRMPQQVMKKKTKLQKN
jgi:hypothetical protein